MADITIVCPGCGNRITVSEFVSAEFLVCIVCHAKVPVPKREPPAVSAGGLRMAAPPEPPPEPIPEKKGKSKRHQATVNSPSSDVSQFLPSTKRQQRRHRHRISGDLNILPWSLFVALTLALMWLRWWPGILSVSSVDFLSTCGVWILIGLQVAVVLRAFNDDAFHGVMCAIIPGYSIYYLFVCEDQFYLRAIAAAILITFGWDASVATHKLWQETYDSVSWWLRDTDYLKKKVPH